MKGSEANFLKKLKNSNRFFGSQKSLIFEETLRQNTLRTTLPAASSPHKEGKK